MRTLKIMSTSNNLGPTAPTSLWDAWTISSTGGVRIRYGLLLLPPAAVVLNLWQWVRHVMFCPFQGLKSPGQSPASGCNHRCRYYRLQNGSGITAVVRSDGRTQICHRYGGMCHIGRTVQEILPCRKRCKSNITGRCLCSRLSSPS